MRPSSRLKRIPPYLFAELERKISAKRAAGIDVISLGIGDPDTPTYPPIVAAAERAVADPTTHTYPSNPTGAVVPDGFFEAVVELATQHDFLVVHDNAYSETTYDGYVAPSFLSTPGAKDVGVEVFSLSKGYNMTGWRCAAIVGNADAIAQYWRLKSNIDSGLFDAVQLAGAAALAPELDAEVRAMNLVYKRRRDLVCDALAHAGVRVTPPKGTIYIWAPVPEGFE